MKANLSSNSKADKNKKEGNNMRSVRRCFQTLEYFDQERRPLSATDLANELEAPLSSMIDLLKCLCDLGYVAYDNRSRTYHPTTRVGLVGDWLNTNPLSNANYAQLVTTLQEKSKETIAVFWQNDTEMKCVTALQGSHAIAFICNAGDSFPLFGSAVGHAVLSKWSNAEIKKTYQRFKRQAKGNRVLPLKSYMPSIEQARADGYATGYEMVEAEVGAITSAMLINNNRWMVFSVAGLSQRIKKNEDKLAKLLIEVING